MQTLRQFQAIFQGFLSRHSFQNLPQELYEPVNYILSIGGKRLRPVLLLISHSLFDGQVEKALPAALAVEVLHNFTLLHDDIMDAAPLRRGKPTVHVKYDLNTGILSGDVMLVYAYHHLIQVEDKSKIAQLLSVFNRVAIDVCEGQQYDMNFEERQEVTIAEYLKMIELKTAVLIAGAMEMGALLGNASRQEAQHLFEFGRNIGIAFQLQDDLLDTFGDPSKFGKKVGGDIVQNKKTYLVLKALEIANASTRRNLAACFTMHELEESKKVETVIDIFNKLKIKDLAETEKEKYLETAKRHLAAIPVSDERKIVLTDLANQLMAREI